MILFRIVLLYIVSWLGAVVFYSRKQPEPRALMVLAAVKALVVCLWTVGAFLVMTAVEWALINP